MTAIIPIIICTTWSIIMISIIVIIIIVIVIIIIIIVIIFTIIIRVKGRQHLKSYYY